MSDTKRTITLPQEALLLLREVLFILQKGSANEGVDVWLVGGTIRDLIIGKTPVTDFDLAVSVNPLQAASEYAKKKKAGFVVLDEERGVARIVKNIEGRNYTVDLAQFRAPSIKEDLQERDYTINAMAAPLKWPQMEACCEIYDPLSGWTHLQDRLIIQCSDHAFIDDPLRLMRGFRFGAQLDGIFGPGLSDLIARDGPLLADISQERIRDELFKILATPNSANWIDRLSKEKLLHYFLPELELSRGVSQNDWHHLDVYDHTIEMLRKFESLLNDDEIFPGDGKFRKFLGEHISGDRTFEQLFKFGCLLHDLGKPICRAELPEGKVVFYRHEMEGVRLAKDIAQRLHLSNSELQFLQGVVKNHMRPGVIFQDGLTDRRLFRYYSETGRDGVGIALMSLSDRHAALGPQVEENLEEFSSGMRTIMADFYKQMEYVPQAPIINGTDLVTCFSLKPGPAFKEILDAVSEAQYIGAVTDKKSALEFVSKHLSALRSGSDSEQSSDKVIDENLSKPAPKAPEE